MKENNLPHLEQIIEQTSDAIFSTDKFYRIKTWNKASEILYGFTAEEAIGKDLGLLLKSRIEEARINGLAELHKNGIFDGEYEFIHKNGCPICVHAKISILRDADNSISGYVAIHRNITERKKLEEKLKAFNKELEEQVKKKTAQLTNIFERITDAFVALDNNWCFTYMNKKACEIFNRTPESIIGKHIWTEIPEGHREPFYHAYHKAMNEQCYIYLEAYYKPHNRWVQNHIYPSPEGISIFFQDITANKQIEEQAKLNNQKLLLHLTNSPLAVIEWDTELVITSWSPQAERIFEWNTSEVVGKKIEDINLVFEADKQQVLSVIDGLLTGSLNRLINVNRNTTKTGRVIYCEWYSSILKDDNGNVISCMSLIQEVTEQKKFQDALTFSEQQLSLIYNSSSDIIFLLAVIEERYQFISVNDAFKDATGLTSDQILNRYVEEVIPQSSLQQVLTKYKEAIETKKTVHWEEVSEYLGGTKTGFVSVTPVYDNNQKCIRLVGFIHDVTKNKLAELELREKNEELRLLSAHLQNIREEERTNIAREIHDVLGERLTGLRLNISWIERQLPSSLDNIKEKFAGLIHTVDDTIKTVRKISTELRPSILDDFGLIDALEWQASEFAKTTRINCKVKSFLTDNIDSKQIVITLFRIFQESLTNILRHAEAENVWAQLLPQGNKIELTITDDGVGMNMEAVKGKQTLGLMGMKERVLMVNGEFTISSEPGKGTRIAVSVPYK